MANREELGIIRGARAGSVTAQLELGKRYLFGSVGLPKSLPTALHWLERAAQQDSAEACELIGTHIPIELARQSPRPLAGWYERAHDAGVVRAGIVFAQLVLSDAAVQQGAALRAKALRALESAAEAGFADAQRLLAQHRRPAPMLAGAMPQVALTPPAPRPVAGRAPHDALEAAWVARDWQAYLARALPLADALAQGVGEGAQPGRRLAPAEVLLLSRCAQLLDSGQLAPLHGPDKARRFWELAAGEHDRDAQLAMGLWCARMRLDGRRMEGGRARPISARRFAG